MKKSLYILIIIFWTTKLFAGPKPSLFDIKINDNVEDYSLLEKGQEIFDYSNFLKKDLINYAWMEVEAGFFKMTENENFVNYAVYLEEQDTINKLASNVLGEKIMNVNIVGVEAFSDATLSEDENDLKAEYGCIDVRGKFIEIYSDVFQINMLNLKNENYLRDAQYNQFITTLFYSFKFKNNPMTIEFACRYNLDENNSLKSQLWVYIMLPNLKKERYATLGYKITNLSSKEILNKLTILKGF